MLSEKLVFLAQDIPRVRKNSGISQKEISDFMGIMPGTFSRWERNGFKTVKLSQIIKIVKYLESKEIILSDYQDIIPTSGN